MKRCSAFAAWRGWCQSPVERALCTRSVTPNGARVPPFLQAQNPAASVRASASLHSSCFGTIYSTVPSCILSSVRLSLLVFESGSPSPMGEPSSTGGRFPLCFANPKSSNLPPVSVNMILPRSSWSSRLASSRKEVRSLTSSSRAAWQSSLIYSQWSEGIEAVTSASRWRRPCFSKVCGFELRNLA